MDTAIDTYAHGKEKEVRAWKGQTIRASSGRFYCPICLKKVALNINGYFQHTKRDAETDECERRVNSYLGSAYEKTGIPIFIKQENEGFFKLYLGFAAQPSSLLKKCAATDCFLEIKGAFPTSSIFNINELRFSSESVTYLPIDNLPVNGCYTIDFSEEAPSELLKKWTTYTDGWGGGRFFKYSEEYCRKVRLGGTILTDNEYYYSGPTALLDKYSDYIDYTYIGDLPISSYTYKRLNIYKFLIRSEHYGDKRFSQMEQELFEAFRISISTTDSQLVPLWPPCFINDDELRYDTNTLRSYMLVDSPFEKPRIYKYGDHSCEQLDLDLVSPAIVRFYINNEDAYSVDRAFNGNIQFIRKSSLQQNEQKLQFTIMDKNDNPICDDQSISIQELKIVSNFKGSILITNPAGEERLYSLEESGTRINSLTWGDTLCIYNSVWQKLYEYTFVRAIQNEDYSDIEISKKLLRCRGKEIIISQKEIALFRKIKDKSSVKVIVQRYLKKGTIPETALRILKQSFGGNN